MEELIGIVNLLKTVRDAMKKIVGVTSRHWKISYEIGPRCIIDLAGTWSAGLLVVLILTKLSHTAYAARRILESQVLAICSTTTWIGHALFPILLQTVITTAVTITTVTAIMTKTTPVNANDWDVFARLPILEHLIDHLASKQDTKRGKKGAEECI